MTGRDPSATLFLNGDRVVIVPNCTEITGKPYFSSEHLIVDLCDRDGLTRAVWKALSMVRYDYPDTATVPPDRDKTVVKKLGFSTWMRMWHSSKVIAIAQRGDSLCITPFETYEGKRRVYKVGIESAQVIVPNHSPEMIDIMFSAFKQAEL